jgi:hypothetical protein
MAELLGQAMTWQQQFDNRLIFFMLCCIIGNQYHTFLESFVVCIACATIWTMNFFQMLKRIKSKQVQSGTIQISLVSCTT